MEILIFKNGRQHGPFIESDVRAFLASGRLVPADLARRPDATDWQPLAQLLPDEGAIASAPPAMPAGPAAPPPLRATPAVPQPQPGGFSDAEILAIANQQKILIWIVLAGLFAFFIRYAPLVTGLPSAVYIYRLARALHKVAWGYAIAAFIPVVGLITLLAVNSDATAALRGRGIRVGLMGGNQDDMDRLKAPLGCPLRVLYGITELTE